MSKTKTVVVSDNGREAPTERALTVRDVLMPVFNDAQISILTGRTPKHAIKSRPGRGGKTFRYVPHGYVTDMLNKAFGFGWSYRLLPVFNGNIYQLTITQEKRWDDEKKAWKDVTVRNLAIYGELSVSIRNPKTLEVIDIIVKPGPGSQNWEETVEFGDALKGAKSDGLKVAAHELGIALDLYYDDDAELQAFAERERKQTELDDLKRLLPPTSIAQLLQRALSNWQINAPDICNTLACNIHDLMKMDPAAAWHKLVEHYEQRNS